MKGVEETGLRTAVLTRRRLFFHHRCSCFITPEPSVSTLAPTPHKNTAKIFAYVHDEKTSPLVSYIWNFLSLSSSVTPNRGAAAHKYAVKRCQGCRTCIEFEPFFWCFTNKSAADCHFYPVIPPFFLSYSIPRTKKGWKTLP
jgi:hypothetical protein